MSGIQIKYTFENQAINQFFAILTDVNTYPMFDEIGAYLDSEVAIRFANSIDWQGNPLKPSQRALAENGKTLVDYGHLRDSYTHNVYSDGNGVEHGSNMIYAAIHQLGGKTGRNHAVDMPIRAVMGINENNEDDILDIVQDFYRSAMASAS